MINFAACTKEVDNNSKQNLNPKTNYSVHIIEIKVTSCPVTMQAQLFATTKELKESAITTSHQQNIIEDLKQHMVIATNAHLHAEQTL
jgi:hypothetical protein